MQSIRLGSNPVLVFLDDKGIKAKVVGEYQVQRAAKRALDKKQSRNSSADWVTLLLTYHPLSWNWMTMFCSGIGLNKLRRDAVNDLIQKRIEFYDNRAVSRAGSTTPRIITPRKWNRAFLNTLLSAKPRHCLY